MEPVAIVVIGVLVASVVVAIVFSRQLPWDEIGGETPELPGDAADHAPPSTFDDEAALRALVAEKRARRQAAADGRAVASDAARDAAPVGPPWAHLDPDVVDEARGLVARRRARLERAGKPTPDPAAELERLLGPPHR